METATTPCSVAVTTRDGGRLAEAHIHRPRVHAKRLTPLVEETLAHAGGTMSDLDAVAVSMGPGSYTGLRIGVSTAKGIALATGAALVGVPTLEALAAQVTPFAGPGDVVLACLDARRDDVYAAAYRVADPGETEDDPDPLVLHADPAALSVDGLPALLALDARTQPHVWLVGDGAEKSAGAVEAVAPVTVLSTEDVMPSAVWVARRAVSRLDAGETDDVATFEPFYLKDFQTTPSSSPFE